ncbi:hypothetical protein Scep_026481 [Stephania cephalantha]|uniref:Uncharacterized protein n=1 Tax=Stephania cephalantha TaxID=152367 RepID=A0AAP0EQI8_9MAGN
MLTTRSVDPPLGLGFPDVSSLDDESLELGVVRNHGEALASERADDEEYLAKRSGGSSRRERERERESPRPRESMRVRVRGEI